MKIEYLPDGSPDCPILRVYQHTMDDARRLRSQAESLGSGTGSQFDLSEDPTLKITGCRLRFVLGEDVGVVQSAPDAFECVLSSEAWLEVADLLEPFCTPHQRIGYQWLNEESDISLLISEYANGAW